MHHVKRLKGRGWFILAVSFLIFSEAGMGYIVTQASPKPGDKPTIQKIHLTFYGANDNTPPKSSTIQYKTMHQSAGGTGTF